MLERELYSHIARYEREDRKAELKEMSFDQFKFYSDDFDIEVIRDFLEQCFDKSNALCDEFEDELEDKAAFALTKEIIQNGEKYNLSSKEVDKIIYKIVK